MLQHVATTHWLALNGTSAAAAAAAADDSEDAGLSERCKRTGHAAGRPQLVEAISIAAPRCGHLANEPTAVMHYARSFNRTTLHVSNQRRSERSQTSHNSYWNLAQL